MEQQRVAPRQSNSTTALWAILAGWTLVRLVTLGGRSRHSARAGRAPQHPLKPDGSAPPGTATGAGADDGRGRQADKPTDIPAQGWKDILWRVYEQIGKDRVVSVAAGVTFYALLAIFPAIAALVSIYGLFADPGTIQEHLNALAGLLPGGALEIVGEQVKRITSKGGGALGVGFFIGLATSLWSANAGMKAIIDALNIVYNEEEKRSFIGLNARSLTFTVGAILFLLIALGAVVVLPVALDYLGLGEAGKWMIAVLRWPLLLVGVIVGLALLYRYGPSRDNPKWRWITPGSVIAAVLWLAASMLFSWYVSSFGNYNETYGSLGAVIGFMTWIWLSTIVVLLGAEINAEMEHQTTEDTTKGPRSPLGARRAAMADTVGEAKA
jgi:membrane protein